MISRVAESCFWLNRYVERVEVLSRMLGVNFAFQLDIELAATERWRPLVIVAGQEEDFLKRVEAPQADDGERVQEYLTWNEENPSSVYSSLRAARENARTIRETISLEMWETLNDLWVWLRSKDAHKLYERNRTTFYSRLRDQCLLFHGIAQATMLHEAPFEFMRLGTALERAGQTARVLDVRHHAVGPVDAAEEPPEAIAQWLTILRFCSGVEPFLKRRTAAPSGAAVAEFLLFDPAFARSVLHNLDRVGNFLELVSTGGTADTGRASRTLLAETRGQLASMSIETVLAEGLHETLTWIVETTAELSRAIHRDFFDPIVVRGSSQTQTQAQSSSQGQGQSSA
ncbi:MAG: alpha-E domain-containing protein [Myxococcales bacterium]|nr:alpha-E domain-containing protein [Myxococcales bacterium]